MIIRTIMIRIIDENDSQMQQLKISLFTGRYKPKNDGGILNLFLCPRDLQP